MSYKLMYAPNDDTQNSPVDYISSWNVWTFNIYELTNQKSPKLLTQRIRKLYYKTLGTSVLNSPMSPSLSGWPQLTWGYEEQQI